MYMEQGLHYVYRVDGQSWAMCMQQASEKLEEVEVKDDMKYLSKIAKTSRRNLNGAIDAAIQWLSTANEERHVAKSAMDICMNMKKTDPNVLREHLFSSMIVEPIICQFLPSDSSFVSMKGNSEQLPGSKMRRGKYGRIPDFWLSVSANDQAMTIFVTEIKTPTYMATCTEEEPGFIKLVNQMKDELDFVEASGARNNVPVFGLLVQGYKCKLFTLDLSFYKLYRLVLVDQFHLPTDRYDLDRLKGCMDVMSKLEKNLSNSIRQKLDDFFESDQPSSPSSDQHKPLSLISFSSPHRA